MNLQRSIWQRMAVGAALTAVHVCADKARQTANTEGQLAFWALAAAWVDLCNHGLLVHPAEGSAWSTRPTVGFALLPSGTLLPQACSVLLCLLYTDGSHLPHRAGSIPHALQQCAVHGMRLMSSTTNSVVSIVCQICAVLSVVWMHSCGFCSVMQHDKTN